jgi:hypothetical protein
VFLLKKAACSYKDTVLLGILPIVQFKKARRIASAVAKLKWNDAMFIAVLTNVE